MAQSFDIQDPHHSSMVHRRTIKTLLISPPGTNFLHKEWNLCTQKEKSTCGERWTRQKNQSNDNNLEGSACDPTAPFIHRIEYCGTFSEATPFPHSNFTLWCSIPLLYFSYCRPSTNWRATCSMWHWIKWLNICLFQLLKKFQSVRNQVRRKEWLQTQATNNRQLKHVQCRGECINDCECIKP